VYDDYTGSADRDWEASDRICGKRLRPLVPVMVEAMERHGDLRLAPAVRISLLAMSAAARATNTSSISPSKISTIPAPRRD
jgi:hypothetical protein